MGSENLLLNSLAGAVLLGFITLVVIVAIRFFVDHLKLDRFRNNLCYGDGCRLYVGDGEYADAVIHEIYEDGDMCVSSQYGHVVVSKNKIYPIT